MRRIRHWLWLGTLTLALAGLAPGARAAGVWYVAPAGDNAINCSTPSTPCATLNGVIAKAAAGDTNRAMGGACSDTGADAALITKIGFILSCALCYLLAVRGFKSAEGRRRFAPLSWLADLLVGAAIAAPVYWMFGKLLAINLPGLTSTGWL